MNRVLILCLFLFVFSPAWAQTTCPASGKSFLRKHGIDLSDFDKRCGQIRDSIKRKIDELGGNELFKSCENIKLVAPDPQSRQERLERKGCNDLYRLNAEHDLLNETIGRKHIETFAGVEQIKQVVEPPVTLKEIEDYTEAFACGSLWLFEGESLTRLHQQYMQGSQREVLNRPDVIKIRHEARNAKTKAERDAFCRAHFPRPDGL